MLQRQDIRPDRYYWIVKRKRTDVGGYPTLCYMTGELPCLSMRVLGESAYSTSSASDYEFLGEANIDDLFQATFRGLTLADLLPDGARIAE